MAYADSIVSQALGDGARCLACLRESLAALPTYAPAMLSMGSVEYQLRRRAAGRRRFLALLELPDSTPDLAEILDEAGSFLIDRRDYKDGLELYRLAVERFPHVAALHQGRGCCAGHLALHDEAVAASRAAVALEPANQQLVNDLGWCLFEAGHLDEARATLECAVAMNPKDELARENLRVCLAKTRRRRRRT